MGCCSWYSSLSYLRHPIPPYPTVGGGGGLEVNFGTSANGMGSVQPEQFIPIDIKINQETSKGSKASNDDGEIITQETEEAPAVKSAIAKKNKKNKKEKFIDQESKKESVIQINDPVVNTMALYKKKAKGGSEGITGKAGDQGSPTGICIQRIIQVMEVQEAAQAEETEQVMDREMVREAVRNRYTKGSFFFHYREEDNYHYQTSKGFITA